MDDELIWWLGQAHLHLLQFKDIVILPSHHIRQTSQICHDSPIAILAIEPHYGLAEWNRLRFDIPADRLHRLAQFSSVITVARSRYPRERANPLVRVILPHGRPGSDGLPPLASEIARSKRPGSKRRCAGGRSGGWGKAAYASCLPRAIEIEHEPMRSLSVPYSSCFLLLLQWSCEQVFEKQCAQCFDRSLIQSGKKTTQRRASRQAVAPKECQ